MSTQSSNDEEKDEDEEGDEENDEGDQFEGGEAVGQVDGGTQPFILPLIWMVNDFYLTMSGKVFFNTFWDRYQVPESIPLLLPGKFEK